MYLTGERGNNRCKLEWLWWLKHNWETVWTWWQCRPGPPGGYTYHSLTGRPQPLGFLNSLALFSLLRAPPSPPLKIPLPLTFDFPFSIRLDVAVSQCWNSSPPAPPDGEGNWYLCISSWCHQSEINAIYDSTLILTWASPASSRRDQLPCGPWEQWWQWGSWL